MIAICSMVRKPVNFDTWIDYHFSLGVDYIFLRVEDTPELAQIIDRYENVFAIFDNSSSKRNNYWSQMNRQKQLIQHHLPKIQSLKIDWLFHIDSDELICSVLNLKELLSNVSKDYDVVKIQNYEAVYDRDNLENPFYQTNKFRVLNKLAYSNGKSAARVSTIKMMEYSSPIGDVFCPHGFEGKVENLNAKDIVILHFESPTFESWYEKFSNDCDIDELSFEKIPFDFYKKSIEIVRSGDIKMARDFYNKMKVNVSDPVFKLYWTPQLEYKNVNWSK
jgi:hypothetical protein